MTDVLVTPAFIPTQPDSGDTTKFGPNAWKEPRLFGGGNLGDLVMRDPASPKGASWLTTPVLKASVRQARSWTPHTFTLIGGQDDEVPVPTNCTIVADTVNFKVNDRGWQMSMAGAVTAHLNLDPPGTEDPVVFSTASAIGLWVYLPDVTKITSVTAALFSDAASSQSAATSWTPATGLVTGWNYLRTAAVSMTLTGWGTLYRIRILVVTNAATTATIGHCWLEQQPQAQMIYIADGPYDSFYTLGYPQLATLQVPVTFACDVAMLGTGSGAALRMSTAQIAAAAGVNRNVIGVHSYDGTPTSGMTAAQIRADFMKTVKWIEARGYPTPLWRAAWVQNLATNAAAIRNLVMAYATPSNASGSLDAWPPINKWNIARYGLHGRTQADLDTVFTTLQATRGLIACYAHGINDAGGNDITTAMWTYFVGKVQTAITAGWLEGTTFEELVANTNFGVPGQYTFAPWLGAPPW